jgi:hypothetical protein
LPAEKKPPVIKNWRLVTGRTIRNENKSVTANAVVMEASPQMFLFTFLFSIFAKKFSALYLKKLKMNVGSKLKLTFAGLELLPQ